MSETPERPDLVSCHLCGWIVKGTDALLRNGQWWMCERCEDFVSAAESAALERAAEIVESIIHAKPGEYESWKENEMRTFVARGLAKQIRAEAARARGEGRE